MADTLSAMTNLTFTAPPSGPSGWWSTYYAPAVMLTLWHEGMARADGVARLDTLDGSQAPALISSYFSEIDVMYVVEDRMQARRACIRVLHVQALYALCQHGGGGSTSVGSGWMHGWMGPEAAARLHACRCAES